MFVLGIMLAINGATLVLAVCNGAFRGAASDIAAHAAESPVEAPVNDEPVDAGEPTKSVAEIATTSPTETSQEQSTGNTVSTSQTPSPPPTVDPSIIDVPPSPVTTQPGDGQKVAETVIDNPPANPVTSNNATVITDETPSATDTVVASLTDTLVIINPPGTGGVVHYVLDEKTISLQPGEYFQIPSGEQRRVNFHRGGDLSDVELNVEAGAYVFSVSDAGWELSPAAAAVCSRLLTICRQIQ
jgi:hypothetical protein